jgi:hypothetical protein
VLRRALEAAAFTVAHSGKETGVYTHAADKVYLVRVSVDVDREPPAVVTAYRTRKVEKYWRDSV